MKTYYLYKNTHYFLFVSNLQLGSYFLTIIFGQYKNHIISLQKKINTNAVL